MNTKITAEDIIARWPSKRDLASDISRLTGKVLKPIAVYRWASRGNIPAKYDRVLVRAAEERNKSLSLVDLMDARSCHIDQDGNSPASRQEGRPSGCAA